MVWGALGAVSGGESDMPGPGAQEYAGAEGAQGPAVREVRKPPGSGQRVVNSGQSSVGAEGTFFMYLLG